MITRVSINAQALHDVSPTGGRSAKIAHEHLLKTMKRHAELVFDSDDSARDFVHHIRSSGETLPPGVAKRWQELVADFLKNGRARAARPALPAPTTIESWARSWSGDVDVAVVDRQTAGDLDVPEDEGWMVEPSTQFEVASADAAADCHHFTQLQELAEQVIFPKGTPRDTIWTTVLEPMWRASKHATLIDRYLFKNLWQKRPNDHLSWLLDRMATTPGNTAKHVTLIGLDLAGDSWSPFETLDALAQACSGSAIGSIDLHLVPEWVPHPARPMAHDRHIRFNCGAIKLPGGFDRLGSRTVWDEDGLGWQFISDAQSVRQLQEAELRSKNLPGTVHNQRIV